MHSRSHIDTKSLLQIFVKVVSALTITIGIVVLVGWALEIPFLKSGIPGSVSMKANTAVCFLLVGVALGLLRSVQLRTTKRQVTQILAALVFTIGLLSAIQYVGGWNFGIDEILFRDETTHLTSHPGRMAPVTGVAFILLAAGIVLIAKPAGQYLFTAAYFLSLLAFIGNLFGFGLLYRFAGYTAVAFPTSILFILLSLGFLAARPTGAITSLLMSALPGGRTIRLATVLTTVVIIVLGWLIDLCVDRGIVGTHAGLVVLITLLVVFFSVAIYFGARMLLRAEEQEAIAVRLYAMLSQVNQAIVRVKTPAELYQAICDVSTKFGGLACAWIGLVETTDVRSVAFAGVKPEKCGLLPFNIDPESQIKALIAESIRTSNVVTCIDLQVEERNTTIRELFQSCDCRAFAAIPFRLRGKAVGVLSLISPAAGMFQAAAEIRLLEEMGTDISFALDSMDTEAERVKAEENFSKAFHSNPGAMKITRASDGRYLELNEAYTQLVGYQRDELLGHPTSDFHLYLHPDQRAELVQRLHATGSIRNYEAIIQTKPGDTRTVIASLELVLFNNEAAILSTFIDITDRKNAEREIQKLNAELEERVRERTAELEGMNDELESFSYSVSHDLRAPVRHISGFVELLNKSASGLDEKSRHYLTTIANAARQMGTLIDELLAFSRMGRAALQKTEVHIDQLVQQVMADLHVDTTGRNIDWRIGFLPPVFADRTLLKSVVTNLISNAVKFTSTRPTAVIEISAHQPDAHEVVYAVRDNGVGFDMQYVEKLFGLFQRLHGTHEFEGTGVGLANVRRIIHRHGGRAWAEGVPDGGAAFYFSLPLRETSTCQV
ncbi:MAG: PAS domain S-box protein [Ignavibacteriae bacterium]|nr:PAS domain S-box protein [Ignavibacteriota bacterium]